MTLRQLLEQLISEQRIPSKIFFEIHNASSPLFQTAQNPWYVRVLIGISAWLAAILFLVFLFSIGFIEAESGAVILGIVLLLITTIVRWHIDQIFSNQLMLAFHLAGQAMFLIGMASLTDHEELTATLMLGVEITLIIVYRDTVMRFLSTLFSYVAVVSLGYMYDIPNAVHLLIILTAFAVGVLWYYEAQFVTGKYAQIYTPVRYGITIALLFLLIPSMLPDMPVTSWWISTLGLLVVLLIVESRVLAYHAIAPIDKVGLLVLAATVLFAAPLVTTPGIIAAIFVLVLGFQRGQRLLMGLTLVFLTVFIVAFYYHLDVSLLVKSLILAASGAVLLVMRWLLLRQFGVITSETHAHT